MGSLYPYKGGFAMYMVDAHCDTATFLEPTDYSGSSGKSQVDFASLCRYGVGVQFWAIWQDRLKDEAFSFQKALYLLEASSYQAKHCPGMGVLTCREQLDRLAPGQSLLLLGLEGAEQLEGDLANLERARQAGCGFIGLTWNHANEAASGCLAARDEGLTPWGKELVIRMEEMGILVDLAHASPKTFWDTLEIARKPLIVSHTCCDALYNHPRNLNDTQLKALAAQGGVAGITFVGPFLAADGGCMQDVVAHILHGITVAGLEHIGIGSDFDGTDPIPGLAAGTCCLPDLARALLESGLSPQEIRCIMGGNFARILKENLQECGKNE